MSENTTDWEQLYKDDFMPWDTGQPDSHLIQMVKEIPINPCRALELGCGTGTNAIWLAGQGFTVVATDLSETALTLAREKDGSEKCEFILADFLNTPLPGTDFGFVTDMSLFHVFHEVEQRDQCARKVAACLTEKGMWLSVSGSCDGPEIGPPRRSARDITLAVEPYFEILSMTATTLDELSSEKLEALGLPPGTCPRAWCCLMQKRAKTEE